MFNGVAKSLVIFKKVKGEPERGFFSTCYSLAGEMLAAGDLEGPDIKGFGSIVAATGHAVVWTYVAVQTHRVPRTFKVAYDVEKCCLYFRAGMTRVECDLSLEEIDILFFYKESAYCQEKSAWKATGTVYLINSELMICRPTTMKVEPGHDGFPTPFYGDEKLLLSMSRSGYNIWCFGKQLLDCPDI
jgi:hypothetical protein